MAGRVRPLLAPDEALLDRPGLKVWVGRPADPLKIAERERRRLGQALAAALGADLRALSRACAALGIPRLKEQAERAAARAREVARGAYPAGLTAEGLRRGVLEAARRAGELSGVRCRVVWGRAVRLKGNARARHLYSIVGEALSNALRHGRPRKVWIRAAVREGTLRVTVRDDGRGFEPGASTPGLGLRLMRARARALDAKLSVEPRPGGGTIVDCRVPAGRGKA